MPPATDCRAARLFLAPKRKEMQQKIKRKLGKLCLSLAVILVCVSFALTQAKPRTVTEFYMAMPTSFNIVKNLEDTPFREGFFFNEFYENEGVVSKAAIIKHRRSLIKIEDIANGYLKLQPKDSNGWEEVALFKKADGNYLIAISQVECAPCAGDLMILAYDNKGTWTNVTKQVFGTDSQSYDGYFKLPRTGTTIELACGDESNDNCKSGAALADYDWNKTKFVKRPAAK